MGGCVQTTLHVEAIPVSTSMVHRSPSSGHVVGQLPSQVSGDVTTPSPQRGAQSASLPMLHVPPVGQQPSPTVQAVIGCDEHTRLQAAALPMLVLVVQGSESVQLGHGMPGGSQVSAPSIRPLPHPAQSLSVAAVQFMAQQPSPPTHSLMVCVVQAKLQFAALPIEPLIVQAFVSVQELGAGQELGGSQVSPGSGRPLPQPWQSLSMAAEQPGGQQLSLF